MFAAILILLLLPVTDVSRSRGMQFRPLSKAAFFVFVANFLILMQLGAKHVESPFIEFGQISTVLYFSYFTFVMYGVTVVENTFIALSQETSSHLNFNYSKLHSSHLQSSFNYAFFKNMFLNLKVSISNVKYTQPYIILSSILTTKGDILDCIADSIKKETPVNLASEARNNAHITGRHIQEELANMVHRKERALNLAHVDIKNQAKTENLFATIEEKEAIKVAVREAGITLEESHETLRQIAETAIHLL